jgi:TatD DNase family protein
MSSGEDFFIFDTHCHLSDEKYQNLEIEEIINETIKLGIKILNVGYDKLSNEKVVKQLEKYPNLLGALGLHPNSNGDLNESNLLWIETNLHKSGIKAIGEIGLDYYHSFTEINKQKKWFKKQLELAKKHDLPVLIHVRDAFDDVWNIIKEVGNNKGIIHCFTGDIEFAKKFISLGFYISFSANITYPSSNRENKIKNVLSGIPLERILIETDYPYLSPQNRRGEVNYPKNIVETLKKIILLRDEEDENFVTSTIYENSLRALNIEKT